MLIPYMTHLFCSGCKWTMYQLPDSMKAEDGVYKALARCGNPQCANGSKLFQFDVPTVNGVEVK